jgi:hypothetical protein
MDEQMSKRNENRKEGTNNRTNETKIEKNTGTNEQTKPK